MCPEAPAPPTWGFGVRVFHLATQLARRHRVTLLAYASSAQLSDWSELARSLHRVRPVQPPPSFRSRRRRQLISLCGRSSFHLSALRSQAMQRAIQEELAGGGFDMVQVESSAMMCFDFGTTAVVLDEHNIEYDLLRQVARVESSPVRRLYGAVEANKVRHDEREAWGRSDGCVTTSLGDEAVVRRTCTGLPTTVVPNAVDTDRLRPARAAADPERMVFVGKMNYRPNADAVAWFARRVLPRVRRVRPGAVLEVVGDEVPASLRGLAGVRYTGWVPDIRPFLERAGVVVAPLRAGGGTRLKILEALSMARPVVSTTVGAAGIDVVSGMHLILADEPDAMADQILRLMADPALGARLGAEGRSLMVDHYGWTAAANRLEAFHAEVTGGPARRR
ncbi:MAG: glycosyltransferase [Candidatus Dormiibacterota bacterium]